VIIIKKRGEQNTRRKSKMKKLALMAAILMVLSVFSALAVDVDTGLGIIVDPVEFPPICWIDNNARVVSDDCNEPGAISGCNEEMHERVENYAFTGESIYTEVLCFDKNGDDKINDVFYGVRPAGSVLDELNPFEFIEANCEETSKSGLGYLEGQVYYLEEQLTWNDDVMQWYDCEVHVEPGHHGEYWVDVVAVDFDGLLGLATSSEYWFLNPVIGIGINGQIDFGAALPGARLFSTPVTVGNLAEAGSGVMLDMFIAGEDFYDPSNSGAKCPVSNVLELSNFAYYAVGGAYNTCSHPGGNGAAAADAMCYVGIPYFVTGVGDVTGNNNMNRIILGTPAAFGVYPAGNVLSPGAELTMTFRLDLPEPCNGGSFSDGQLWIRGEAV
jgi:hypothetical protein